MSEAVETLWRKVARLIGVIPENVVGRRPKDSQAGARVALASLTQISGTAIVIFPLWLEMGENGWKRDCYHIGLTFGVIGTFVLFGTLIYIVLLRDSVKVVATEWIIRIIYTTNIVALSLAMARVGDPSSSVFGHVVPLQLSGILLLEQQKDSMTSPSRFAAIRYGVVAVLIWVAAVALRERIIHWPFWTGDIEPCTSGCNDKLAILLLIPFEIAFTVLAYYLSRSKWFLNLFVKKKRRAMPSNKTPDRRVASK
jgi:hypothetical protein